MNTKHDFAEIIESCLDHFTGQTWQWNRFPTFGSLVRVHDNHRISMGVVTHIQTGSIDPMRTPFPYQKTEAELLSEQPQIFEFLKTTFKVQLVGYQDLPDNKIYYIMPPTPCKIHAFIGTADEQLRKAFFSSPDYLHLLFAFGNSIPNLDELLIALIKQLIECKLFDDNHADNLCTTMALLTGNDYRRLKLLLKRIDLLLL